MSRATYTRAAAVRPSFDWAGSTILVVGLTLTIASLRLAGSSAWWIGGAGAVLLVRVSILGAAGRIASSEFSLLKRGAFLGGGSIITLQNLAMRLFQLPVFLDRYEPLARGRWARRCWP